MDYRIIVDSCGEFTPEMKADAHFLSAPLILHVDDEAIIDDETFDQASFLKKVQESPNCPKSACPSPETYMNAYHCDAENVYVVTLSAELSGSYNSAVLGKRLYEEEYGAKNIHVFNSKSASVGESSIALKIAECEKQGLSFQQVIEEVNKYIHGLQTFFVLETLEHLRKNGRLTGLKAVVASVLNIKPVMSAEEGVIIQLDQARGIQKALKKMIDYVIEHSKETKNDVLAIAHCNCLKRAEMVRDELLKRAKFRDIILVDTGGVSTLYAADGGIIVTL